MRSQQEHPTTPPCHKDRLFEEMKKYTRSQRATQLVPCYREFRLGHGDPLMQAVMKHWNDMAYPKNTTKDESLDEEKEIHLIEHGSPVGGIGMHDIVHVGNQIIDIPCLPLD